MSVPSDNLPEELKRELDRRIADMEANPDDEVPWEVVEAELKAVLAEVAAERAGEPRMSRPAINQSIRETQS